MASFEERLKRYNERHGESSTSPAKSGTSFEDRLARYNERNGIETNPVSSATPETPQPKVNYAPNQYTAVGAYTDTASRNYSREDILRMLADAKVAQEQERALREKEAEEDAFRRGFGDAMLQGAGLPTTAAGSSPDMNVVKKGGIEAYTDAGTRKTSREDRLREQGVRDIVRENEAQPERTAYRYENMPSSQLRAEWQEKNDDAAIISELLGGNGQIVPLWVNESNFDSVYKPDNYNTEQIENARDIISKRKYIANKYNAQIVDDGEKYRDALNRVLDRIGGGNIAYRDANGNAVTYANLFYENENKEKAAAVRKDKKYAPIYAEAEQLDKDIAFLDSVTNAPADAYQYNEGLADIEKRYGVTLRNNPTAATNSNLLADRNALDELWLRLNDKRDEDAAKLKEGGYDYGRMSEYTRRLADRERLAEDRARYEKMAEDYPILMTIANLFSGFGQLVEGIDALVSGKGGATPGGADSYVPMNTARANTKAFSESVNSTVSKKIEEDILDLTGSDTLAWLVSRGYSGVTSVATSLITMGTSAAMFGPAGEAIGLSLLGSGAGMNAMVDAAERGANNADAIFYGLAAGINEALFEKLSFDRFVKIKGSWNRNEIAKSIANWLWQSAKQGGVEASEEVFTDIANRIADNIINDKTSEYETDVARYKKQGLTTSEAQERAKLDFIEQVVESAYGGFIGGGASAATKSFANIMRERAQELRNIAPAKRAAKGNDIAKKIASGKELTTEEAKLVIADPKTSFAVQETTGIDFSGLAIKNGVYTNAYTPEQVKSILTDWYDNAVEGRATRVESPAQPMPRISLKNSIEQNLTALAQTPTAAETSEISAVSPAENTSEGNFTSAEINARNAEITSDKQGSWNKIADSFGENGREAMRAAYDDSLNEGELRDLVAAFAKYYEAGLNESSLLDIPESITRGVVDALGDPNEASAFIQNAIRAGTSDAALTNAAESGTIVSQDIEGGNTYGRQGRELRVPRISVRESVQSTREQGGGVSGATRENQEGRIDSRRGAESSRNGEQNARRVQEVQAGQKVSPKQLGLKYGTDKQNTVVTPSSETLKTAHKLGVKVIAVKGALEMRGDDGKTFRVNGASFVDPETGEHTIVVQSDNPKYTERQILLHEATHEELRQGRVSRQEIHDTINELANSEEEVWELFNAYAREYGETYTEKQILDEIFCDAKAAMDRWGVKGAKKAMDSIRRAAGEVYEASRTAAVDKAVSDGKPISYNDEVDFSRAHDAEYMEAAQEYNAKHGTTIPVNVLSNAAAARKAVLDYMNAHEAELLLPEDIEGKNWFGNNSYGGTLESTTVCTRSLAAQTLMDMVSEQLGRPLTVKETLFLSQDMMNYTSDPECVYCYVAADRRAYREFLGEYIKQRDAALKDIKSGVSKQEAYERFLGTRKDTKNMRSRFNMWLNTTDLITAKDLASLQKLTFERNYLAGLRNKTEAQKSRYNQLKDAMAYAQSASWAKKMVGFTAYNGEILTWTQKRIDELNSHYGARMYSFSDFSPAFILENMQQVTDAAVRGLKMFSYNKAIDFVKIFAPTGMNFNVSVFGYEQNGQVAEDAMQGVPWKEAQELRAEYPGVGIVFVATNDALVDWAKQQDWIDVVIPYHTVRTGKVVADFFGYKDYKQVQEDGKIPGVKYEKGAKKSVYPAEHQNDIVKYVKALDKYNLTPRFPEQITGWREFLNGEMTEQEFRDANPYYMKFVNETRRAPQDTPAVQPIFDADAAISALEKMAKQGGYNPAFGGSIETMNELADEFAENIRRRNAEEDTSFSREEDAEYLRPNQVKSADPVTYDDDGNVIPLSERFNSENNDIRFSRLTDEMAEIRRRMAEMTEEFNLSERELLTNALETVSDEKELGYLESYREKINRINAWEAEAKQLRKDMHSGNLDAAEYRSAQVKANHLETLVRDADTNIIKRVNASKPIQNLLKREQKKAFKEGREAQKLKEKEREAEKILRDRIKKIAKDFNERLQRPTERRWVPRDLIEEAAAVAEMIDPTGAREGTKVKAKHESMKAALLSLKEAYGNLTKSPDPDFKSEFRAEFSDMVGELATVIGDTPVRKMSFEQLQDVYGILNDIRAMLTYATKQIGTDNAADNYDLGTKLMAEQAEIGSLGLTTGKVNSVFRNVFTNPMRAVYEMSGHKADSVLNKQMKALEDGWVKAEEFRMTEQKKIDALRADKNDLKKFNDAVEKPYDFGLTTVDGKPLKISKMQAMQILLTYERETSNANRRHLENYIEIPDPEKLAKGKVREALDKPQIMPALTAFDVNKIVEGMDEWDKRFLNVAREVFRVDAANAINEVTVQTRHRPVATEKAYIPYELDKNLIYKENENVTYNAALDNAGILKSMTPNANQPLIIRGLNYLLQRHIDDVAKIYGLSIPIRNFNKVLNVKEIGGARSVRSALSDNWGARGTNLINQAIADVQASRKVNDVVEAMLGSVKGAMVVGSLVGNLRVWLRQAASYPTAASVISHKALVKGVTKYAAKIKDGIHAKDVWDEIDKITPLHYMRRSGLSDQELGEFMQSKGWKNRVNSKLGKMSPMKWIQAMDVGTTAALFYACKEELKSRGITESDENYKTEMRKLYNQVLTETQPMYDPLHRVEMSKGPISSKFFVFQTQPMQNSGILREGALEFRSARKRYGKGSKEAKAAGRKFARAATSQFVSHLVFTAMGFIANAMLHRVNPYRDDDEGEVTLESIFSALGLDLAKNYSNAVLPFVGNVASQAIDNFINGTNYALISDATVDKIVSTGEAILNVVSKPSWDSVKKLGLDLSTYFGVPGNNLKNLYEAVKYHTQDIINGEFGSFEAGYERTSKQTYNRLYNAYKTDSDKYKSYYDDAVESGKSEQQIKQAMDDRIKQDKGVDHVADLKPSDRYLSPSQQKTYDSVTRRVKSSEVWAESDAANRAKLSEIAYDVIAGSKRNTWKTESVTTENNLTQTEYILYKLALDIVDKPNSNGNYGTYTNSEKAAAVKKAKQG